MTKFALRGLASWLVVVFVQSTAVAESFQGLSENKTLVVWASPANLSQRGGGVLTVDDRPSHFDGIVFGELEPAKWMAGSEFYRRTQRDQSKLPKETADAETMVQVALVYEGDVVTIYHNGQVYSRFEIAQPKRFGKASAVVIGLRHLDAQDRACFAGPIDDARLYDRALTADQLRQLKPNQLSVPPPIAWWNFDGDEPEDVMGAFPTARLVGNAHVESGKLVLDGDNSYLVTPPSALEESRFKRGPDVDESWVLNYHLMHPGAASLPGDPNAAFALDGSYHLHYILRHPWRDGQSFSFVHVTSQDMLHWQWQPTKLQPAFTGHGMFSGTGFLTQEGRPAVIYHGQASGRNQIAIAKDRHLTQWEKPYAIEVKTSDGEEAKINHWDPDCFLIGDTYYAISGGPNPPLMKSRDLKHWTLVGDFMAHQMPDVTIGEDISCPNFFPIGDKWMLLCISHPLGCRYYLGDWDAEAEQFIPEQHHRMNWRREEQVLFGLFQRTDFFAPESVLTPDGRRVMWAWLTSPGPDNQLLDKTIQSLPRELALPDDQVLRIKPIREMASLRTEPRVLGPIELAHPIGGHGGPVPPSSAPHLQRIAELPGESVELRITIPREQALRKLIGFTLFSDEQGTGLPILLRPETGTLRVGTTEAPFAVSDLLSDEDVELRIFVDKYLVEVFANDRQALVAAYPEYQGKSGLNAFTVGEPTTIEKLEIWKLQPANQGFWRARETHPWEPETE
jgi:sucrose-6-phosphate hydrolase SacC (GH32 family)